MANKSVQNQWVSISEAAEFLGVSQDTLRRWDKKGTLIPRRTAGGHRRYSRKQLERSLKQPMEQVLDNDYHSKQKTQSEIQETNKPDNIHQYDNKHNLMNNITSIVYKNTLITAFITILIIGLLAASYILLQINKNQQTDPISPVPIYKTLQ